MKGGTDYPLPAVETGLPVNTKINTWQHLRTTLTHPSKCSIPYAKIPPNAPEIVAAEKKMATRLACI